MIKIENKILKDEDIGKKVFINVSSHTEKVYGVIINFKKHWVTVKFEGSTLPMDTAPEYLKWGKE